MPSDLKVEPVSIACVEASSVTNANIQINASSSLSTYLLRIRIHIYCQIILLFFFRNGAMACFELHSKHADTISSSAKAEGSSHQLGIPTQLTTPAVHLSHEKKTKLTSERGV